LTTWANGYRARRSDPPLLELGRREVAQGRVNVLVHVGVFQEAPDLATSISIVLVLGEVNCLFLAEKLL
jgi:hypothetical protein